MGCQGEARRMGMRSSLAFMLVCLAVSGGRAQKAETQFDRSVDFSRYKTYAWREYNLTTQQNPQNEKLIEHSLVNAVNARLKADGLTESQNNPDFYVSYHGGSGMTHGASGSALKPHEVSNPSTMGTTFTSNTIPGRFLMFGSRCTAWLCSSSRTPNPIRSFGVAPSARRSRSLAVCPRTLTRKPQRLRRWPFESFHPSRGASETS